MALALVGAILVAPLGERPARAAAPQAASGAAAAKQKPDGKKAAEIAVRAVKLYREGKNKEAAELFLQAYDISRRPAQLRNAAKAYEEGGMLDDALALWTRYRDHEGVNDDEKAEAVAHIQLVNEKKKNLAIADSAEKAQKAAEAARVEAERAREAAVASEQASRSSATRVEASRGASIGGWVLVGTGGAALVAGGVVWLLASSKLSSLDDKLATVDGAGLIVGTDPSEVSSEVSGVNTLRVVSGVLLAAGVAAAGSGVAWLLLGGGDAGPARAAAEPHVSIAPIFTADTAGLGVGGTF